MTRGSCAKACSSAATRSWPSSTFAMPTDDPSRAGLTNTGSPSERTASSAAALSSRKAVSSTPT